MKEIHRRNAGLLAGLLGLVIIILIYALFGTVDLVFMKGENEVARLENVSVLSNIELAAEDIKGGEELQFTYGEDGKEFDGDFGIKFEIAKTVVVNFFTFKWQADDQYIVLNAK